jgi:Domain of unknown function (DUF5615)
VSVQLYMDVHVPDAITVGLRLRRVDVLTAQAGGARRLSDALLLDRATALGRVLFSQDEDLLRESAQRQQQGVSFAGVIYAHQLKVTMPPINRILHVSSYMPSIAEAIPITSVEKPPIPAPVWRERTAASGKTALRLHSQEQAP